MVWRGGGGGDWELDLRRVWVVVHAYTSIDLHTYSFRAKNTCKQECDVCSLLRAPDCICHQIHMCLWGKKDKVWWILSGGEGMAKAKVKEVYELGSTGYFPRWTWWVGDNQSTFYIFPYTFFSFILFYWNAWMELSTTLLLNLDANQQ